MRELRLVYEAPRGTNTIGHPDAKQTQGRSAWLDITPKATLIRTQSSSKLTNFLVVSLQIYRALALLTFLCSFTALLEHAYLLAYILGTVSFAMICMMIAVWREKTRRMAA